MDLTLDWQSDGNLATIRQGGVGAARLFGLPFLAGGGYLAYQFLGGVFHPGELTWAGWTLLPLMAAVFLVPGWILVAGHKAVRLDNARGEVIEEFRYYVYTRRTVTPITNGSTVLLRFEEGSTSTTKGAVTNSSRTRFDIHVYVKTPEKPPTAMIGLFSESQKAEALAFAAKAAAFLGISVEDRMVERGDVTSGGVVVEQLEPEEAD